MTREGATATARGMADRFGRIFVVYHCDWWPESEFKICGNEDPLEAGAHVVERLEPAAGPPAGTAPKGLF